VIPERVVQTKTEPNPATLAPQKHMQSFASIWKCMREVKDTCPEGLLSQCSSKVSSECRHMIADISLQCSAAIQRNDVCGGVSSGLPLLRCLRKKGADLYFGCMHTLSKYTPKSEVHGLWRCWVNLRDACGQAAFSVFNFATDASTGANPSVQECMARQPGAVLPQCKMLPAVVSSCEADVVELCGRVTTPGKFIGCIWKHRFQVSPVCKAKYEMLSGHVILSKAPPASMVSSASPSAAPSTEQADGHGPLWKCMNAASSICKGQTGTNFASCAMHMVKLSPVCRVPIGEVVTGCGEDAHSFCSSVQMGTAVLRCLQQQKLRIATVCKSLLETNMAEDPEFNAQVKQEWQQRTTPFQ